MCLGQVAFQPSRDRVPGLRLIAWVQLTVRVKCAERLISPDVAVTVSV